MAYWEVNKVAQLDVYPMPQANHLINQLQTAQYLSTLNLTKTYMNPADHEKATFATP